MLTELLFIVVLSVVAYLVWAKRQPYPFSYQGQRFDRRRDGAFLDAGKRPVEDPSLIGSLGPAYKADKARDDD